MDNYKLLGISMIVLQSVIYGLPDSYVKLVYQEFPVMSFLGCRYALATLLMLVFWGKNIIEDVRQAEVKHYIIPVLCMGSAFLISNSALKYTTVGNAAFVRSSTPIVAAVMLMLFFQRRFTWRDAVILSIVLGGMYCLAVQRGASFSQGFGFGELLSFTAACAMAGSLVFGKDALKYIKPLSLSWLQCVASLMFCCLVGLFDGSLQSTDWNLLEKNYVWGSLLYLTIPCSIGGLQLQNLALKYINSKTISVLQCLYPIVAAVVAYFVLGEAMTGIGILGCVMVISSVLLECLSRE